MAFREDVDQMVVNTGTHKLVKAQRTSDGRVSLNVIFIS